MTKLSSQFAAVAGLLAATVAVVALAVDGARATASPVLGPGEVTVELGIHHSTFDRALIRVRAGTTVRFVVDNDDPIRHELIVGPPEVHRRHAEGTEAAHDPRLGEVTVEPLAEAQTTYVFGEPGELRFACHLPGHLAYGMTGTIEVTR